MSDLRVRAVCFKTTDCPGLSSQLVLLCFLCLFVSVVSFLLGFFLSFLLSFFLDSFVSSTLPSTSFGLFLSSPPPLSPSQSPLSISPSLSLSLSLPLPLCPCLCASLSLCFVLTIFRLMFFERPFSSLLCWQWAIWKTALLSGPEVPLDSAVRLKI